MDRTGIQHVPAFMRMTSYDNNVNICRGSDDVLYYSVRTTPSGGPRAPPLTGPKIESDLPTQDWDERLLGQIDGVDAGIVSGWACLRGQLEKPLQVLFVTSKLACVTITIPGCCGIMLLPAAQHHNLW